MLGVVVKMKEIFKEGESIEIFKILGLIKSIEVPNKYIITLKNFGEGNIGQEFRLKKIYETRNYFIEEIDQNKLMSKKLKKNEHLLILASAVTGSASISAFTSLVGGTSSVVGLKKCALTVGIEKYESIIEKMKHGKTVLLAN